MEKFLNRRAFTLAELLAVVVILAILTGIAIGSYRRSVERAKFSEGLSLAEQVAAARDMYYYDRLYGGATASIPVSFNLLPLELAGASGSTYKGSNFTLSIRNQSYVEATHNDGDYGICVYQEAAVSGGAISKPKCLGLTDEGKEICKSMGYTSPVNKCGN